MLKKATLIAGIIIVSSSLFSDEASAVTTKFTSSSSINSSFDRSKAKWYAETYAAYPGNKNYANYGTGTLGGDCTNFVSQALRYAGLPMNGTTTYTSADDRNNSWFYYGADRPNRSVSWTGAHEFRYYWGTVNDIGGRHAYQMKVYSMSEASTNFNDIYRDLWEGDIVQYVDSGGITNHSQIIHGYNSGDLLVAQHSTNDGKWDKNISLKSSISARKPYNAWFVTIRIKY